MSDNQDTSQESADVLESSEKHDAETEDSSEKQDVEAEDSSKNQDTEDGKPQKKKRGVGLKVLMVVAAVFVVLIGAGGVAYGVFHNNPGFCNLICHTPMDPYVASYQENTSVNPAQTDSSALLSVTIHKDSDQQITCLGCHQDGISEQIQEGMAWVTGNYEIPLEMRLIYKQPKADSNDKSGVDFCLREGCHEGVSSLEDLKASTSDRYRNPHDNHNGNLNCYVCHQTHEQSVLFCTQCHNEVELPDGWLTYKQWEDLNKAATK